MNTATIITLCTVGGFMIAGAGFLQAYPERGYIAHRGYVLDKEAELAKQEEAKRVELSKQEADHHKEVLLRVNKMELAQNDTRQLRLTNQVKDYETELQSPSAQQLPQYKALVQDRIDRASHELKQIDEENKSLFDEKQKLTK